MLISAKKQVPFSQLLFSSVRTQGDAASLVLSPTAVVFPVLVAGDAGELVAEGSRPLWKRHPKEGRL